MRFSSFRPILPDLASRPPIWTSRPGSSWRTLRDPSGPLEDPPDATFLLFGLFFKNLRLSRKSQLFENRGSGGPPQDLLRTSSGPPILPILPDLGSDQESTLGTHFGAVSCYGRKVPFPAPDGSDPVRPYGGPLGDPQGVPWDPLGTPIDHFLSAVGAFCPAEVWGDRKSGCFFD